MTIEDAENTTEKLTKEEILEVIEKFSEKITEFNIEELYRDSYKYEPCANSILSTINSKINIEYE